MFTLLQGAQFILRCAVYTNLGAQFRSNKSIAYSVRKNQGFQSGVTMCDVGLFLIKQIHTGTVKRNKQIHTVKRNINNTGNWNYSQVLTRWSARLEFMAVFDEIFSFFVAFSQLSLV